MSNFPNSIPRDRIVESLRSKGFKISSTERDHDFWHFWHNNEVIVVRTKISRGTTHREYGLPLLKQMRFDLKLDGLSETKKLLLCPMTQQEYTEILKGKGIISP